MKGIQSGLKITLIICIFIIIWVALKLFSKKKTLILTRNFWSILHGYDYIFYNKLWCSIVEFFWNKKKVLCRNFLENLVWEKPNSNFDFWSKIRIIHDYTWMCNHLKVKRIDGTEIWPLRVASLEVLGRLINLVL